MLAELPQYGPFLLEHPRNIVATLIGLALLALLLWRYLVPGVKTTLTERSVRIGADIQQVERQLSDVATLRSDYANRIQSIEQEQRARIAAAVRDSQEARAGIIADAEQAALTVRRHGEEELERERTRQRILFRQQMVQITLDVAEEAVRTQNTDAVQRQLIRNFVAQIAHSGTPLPVPTSNPVPSPVSTSVPASVSISGVNTNPGTMPTAAMTMPPTLKGDA